MVWSLCDRCDQALAQMSGGALRIASKLSPNHKVMSESSGGACLNMSGSGQTKISQSEPHHGSTIPTAGPRRSRVVAEPPGSLGLGLSMQVPGKPASP